jgi:hypothetical protein
LAHCLKQPLYGASDATSLRFRSLPSGQLEPLGLCEPASAAMGGWVHEIDEPGIVSNDSADTQSIELGIDKSFEVVEDQIFINFADFFERAALKEQ